MPLDFPSSPTDGEIYNNYQWSATSGAWKAIPSPKTVAITSSSPPASPTSGDIWIDTTDGSSFYYYDDGTSKQWVEMIASGIPSTPVSLASGGTGAATVAGAQTNLQIPLSPNYIINGGFDIWQRGTTFNAIAASTYFADRWTIATKDAGITLNVSQQTFTPGSAPVSGYEGQFYARFANTAFSTGNTYYVGQKIENVRTFAGQVVTFSYWARVSSGTLTPARVYLNQQFGSGGSAEVDNIGSATPTYTTSWQRFTQTITIPSITGKTIGTNSNLWALWQITPNANVTLDVWGVQLEAGSVATSFRRNAPSIQAELAACQRYYQQFDLSGTFDAAGANGLIATKWLAAGTIFANLYLTTPMRVAPVVTRSIATARYVNSGSGTTPTVNFNSYTSSPTLISYSYLNNAVAVGFGWLDTMGIHYASAEL
jgi:hypothetical protein